MLNIPGNWGLSLGSHGAEKRLGQGWEGRQDLSPKELQGCGCQSLKDRGGQGWSKGWGVSFRSLYQGRHAHPSAIGITGWVCPWKLSQPQRSMSSKACLCSGSNLCPMTAYVRTQWLESLTPFGMALMGRPNNRVSDRVAEVWAGASYRSAPLLCPTLPSSFPHKSLS